MIMFTFLVRIYAYSYVVMRVCMYVGMRVYAFTKYIEY